MENADGLAAVAVHDEVPRVALHRVHKRLQLRPLRCDGLLRLQRTLLLLLLPILFVLHRLQVRPLRRLEPLLAVRKHRLVERVHLRTRGG